MMFWGSFSTILLSSSSELRDCADPKAFSSAVFLSVLTIVSMLDIFTEEMGEKIVQAVKINSTGDSSLQGTKGQERRQYGEVLPPPSFKRHRMFSNIEILFPSVFNRYQTENFSGIRDESRQLHV